MTNKTLFWSFYVSFCTFYASLRLKRTVFSRPKTCLPHEIAQRYLFGVISVAKNLFTPLETCFCFLMGCNPWLINDLRSTKAYVRKNKLFMQNKANFRKVKFNVNRVLTKDYGQMDTWSIRKTKPIQTQYKANTKPIQSQLKPKQTQFKPNSNPIQTQSKPKQTQYKAKQTQFQCTIMLNCAICSANTSAGPGNWRESADTYYDMKNTLVKRCEMAMIMHNVACTMLRPKGNSNSRSKYAFEVETIQFGGNQL